MEMRNFLENMERKKNLKVFSRKIDITTLGKKEGLTLEEAGREAKI